MLAGVPSVMQAMLDSAVKSMKTGAVMLVETVEAGPVPEGRYGDALGKIAAAHPEVSIGSYPSFKDGRFSNQIVVRGKDEAAVAAALRRSRRCWSRSGATPSRSEAHRLCSAAKSTRGVRRARVARPDRTPVNRRNRKIFRRPRLFLRKKTKYSSILS